ncbi:glutathione S-transferase family protein [Undibacterium sp. TJN25]|uniref:glutathione S-transferase family protein n=1 Tax=Undibacterium sp. TJN25 TaxID=3413056 RepID=UPI003BF2A70F
MRLYHHRYSASARRAVMTAIHLGLPVELATLDLTSLQQRRQLTELNANSKVPVLVDGDFVLWESCAIMQYLAELTPGQTVYPADARARVNVNRWLFWLSQHFGPALGIYVWENMMKSMYGVGTPDKRELERGKIQIEQFAQVLDDHLRGREWMCGSGLTLADFAVASPLMYIEQASLPLQQYEHIQAWFARVQQLDAWRKTELK